MIFMKIIYYICIFLVILMTLVFCVSVLFILEYS